MKRLAIYLIRAENGLTKIGLATSPRKRLSTLRCDSPIPLELVHMAVVDDAAKVEAELHIRFADKRSHGEWFGLTDADVAFICETYPATKVPYMGDKQSVVLGLFADEYGLIHDAATIIGMPMTQFITFHALAAARKTLGKSALMDLTSSSP